MSDEPQMPPPETLLRAFKALGKLVADEYGERYTLAEVAGMHGVGGLFMEDFTDEDVDAIRAVEDYLDAQAQGHECLRVPAVTGPPLIRIDLPEDHPW